MLKQMNAVEMEMVEGGKQNIFQKAWSCTRMVVDEVGIGLGYVAGGVGSVAAVAGGITLDGPLFGLGLAGVGLGSTIANNSLGNLENSKKACLSH